MAKKDFYKSKSFWGACAVVVGAIMAAVGYPDFGKAIAGLGAALGIVGIRDAQGKLRWFD